MLHYFYVLDHDWLETKLRPALATSWRHRDFAWCRDLCRELMGLARLPADALIAQVIAGLPFERGRWQALVGECLVLGAIDMPRLPCLAAALRCLLSPPRTAPEPCHRAAYQPLEQVYFGTRDLRFGGGWHRPEHVGCNDVADVVRLSNYLQSVRPEHWSAAALPTLVDPPDPEDHREELAYLREQWPALVAMYQAAAAKRQVIVCEKV